MQAQPRRRPAPRAHRREGTPLKRLLLWLWKRLPLGKEARLRLLWLLNTKFIVGVAGVVVDDQGRVLLLHHTYRTKHPWGLPGGFAHAGEQPHAALVRELKEEVGLPVRIASVLEVSTHPAFPSLEVVYLCRPASPLAEPVQLRDPEIDDAGFFAPEAFPGPLAEPQRSLIRQGRRALGFE